MGESQRKTLGEWLLFFGIVRTVQEAKNLTYGGSVKINGNTTTDYLYELQPGDIIRSMSADYTYCIPGDIYLTI